MFGDHMMKLNVKSVLNFLNNDSHIDKRGYLLKKGEVWLKFMFSIMYNSNVYNTIIALYIIVIVMKHVINKSSLIWYCTSWTNLKFIILCSEITEFPYNFIITSKLYEYNCSLTFFQSLFWLNPDHWCGRS